MLSLGYAFKKYAQLIKIYTRNNNNNNNNKRTFTKLRVKKTWPRGRGRRGKGGGWKRERCAKRASAREEEVHGRDATGANNNAEETGRGKGGGGWPLFRVLPFGGFSAVSGDIWREECV